MAGGNGCGAQAETPVALTGCGLDRDQGVTSNATMAPGVATRDDNVLPGRHEDHAARITAGDDHAPSEARHLLLDFDEVI